MKAAQNSGMKHLDEMTCLLYLEGQLERPRALEVSAHTQECEGCRTLLRALERESRLLTRAMLEEEEPLPATLAAFQERVRRSLQWIWMLAFGLASTGVYALYTGYVQPLQDRLEQAGFGGTNLLGLLIFQGTFWKGWQSMISLIEVLAMATLLGSAVLVLRRRLRRGSALALVLAGLCAAVALPAPAAATEWRKGQTVEIGKDETVTGDVFLAGAQIRVDGTVDGDVFAWGQEVTIRGHVTGDVIGGAQAVRIQGQVDGNVRTWSNSLDISGSVGKNVLCGNQTFNLDTSGKIGKSLTAFSQTIELDGTLGRDLYAFAQSTSVLGTVNGSIEMKGQTLSIGSGATVNGTVKYQGEHEASVSPGAKLASPVQFTKYEHKPEYLHGSYYFWRLLWTASFILYGLVLIKLMPQFAGECTRAAESIGASLGLGILVGISAPIAALIACVTFVGFPLGILTMMSWLVLLFSAQIVIGSLLGRWVLGATQDTWGRIGRMALGMAIIGVIVPIIHQVPVAEFFFKLAVVAWGFGAISLAIYRRLSPAMPGISVQPPVSSPLPPTTTVGGAAGL